jgi:predicted Zn finger-like uncharacterized protein
MLVNCNSCQKKFEVPDSAITVAGRLLQCGSCGNKWTQYPIKAEIIGEEKLKRETSKLIPAKPTQPSKIKKTKKTKKKKREINLYSEEYLKKKHGLTIKDSEEHIKIKKNSKISKSSSFFTYLIFIIIFITSFFGILNLTKDFIIINYPFTESYINSLYEVVEILKAIFFELLN